MGATPSSTKDSTEAEELKEAASATRKSNRALIMGITAMVLLFGAAVGSFWAYNRFVSPPAVSPGRVLPSNTLAYLTIDPSPDKDQKEAFDELRRAFEAQPGFAEAWANFTDEASDVSGLDKSSADATALTDFDTLSSYLGSNITLAVLPPGTTDLERLRDASGDNEEMLDVLKRNIVGLVDLDFNPFNKKGPLVDLQRQASDGARTEAAEKYRDIEIRKYITGTLTLYFSLLPATSTAVIGAEPEPVRTVIERFILDEGLKYDPTYKALVADLPTERVLTLYVNLTEISRQAQIMGVEDTRPTQLEGSGAWMATLGGNPDGLQVNIVAQTEFGGAGTLLLGAQGIDVEINPRARPQVASLYDVPQDSLAFIVGTDLKSMAESALGSFRSEDPRGAAQMESEIRDNIGLDLKRDILPLLAGDYIGSLSAGGTLDSPVPAFVFQQKLSPEGRAESGEIVPRLIDGVSNDSPINETVDAGNIFYSLPDSSDFTIALTADRLMYIQDESWGEARERAKRVAANTGKGLGGTDEWKAISKHLPVDSNLIVYADVEAMREMAERNMPEDQEREYRQIAPFLRPVNYILIGSANYPNIATKEPQPVSKLRSHTVVFVGIGGQGPGGSKQ